MIYVYKSLGGIKGALKQPHNSLPRAKEPRVLSAQLSQNSTPYWSRARCILPPRSSMIRDRLSWAALAATVRPSRSPSDNNRTFRARFGGASVTLFGFHVAGIVGREQNSYPVAPVLPHAGIVVMTNTENAELQAVSLNKRDGIKPSWRRPMQGRGDRSGR